MPQTSDAPQSNVPAGYTVDQSSLTANPNGEGTYRMAGPDGQTVQVPFSKVLVAENFRFQVVGDPSDSKTDAGRYLRDAAVVAPSFLHSVETSFGVSIPQLKAEELEWKKHLVKNLLEVGVGGPAYAIAKSVVQQAQHSYSSAREAISEYRGGNTYAAIADAVEAIPIVGPGINAAAEQAPVSTGSYWRDLGHVVTSGATMGTVLSRTVQAGAALDGLSRIPGIVRGIAGGGLAAGASEAGGTSVAMAEGAGTGATTVPADAAPPVDATSATEGEGGAPATPPADAAAATEPTGDGPDDDDSDGDGPGGGGASAATPPVESGSASVAVEAASATPPVYASAPTPVDAAPALGGVSIFKANFLRTVQLIRESELGQRAPEILQDGARAALQNEPDFELVMPGGIPEMPQWKVYTLPSDIGDWLRSSVFDPTTGETMGPRPGVEVGQQGSDGGGLAKPPDAVVQSAPETTVTPAGQATTESSSQPAVDAGATQSSNTQPTNTQAPDASDTPTQSDLEAAGASGGKKAAEDSAPLRAYTASLDVPAPEKPVYRKLTPAEKAFKKELEDAGHTVIQIPTGPYKTPDFLVDGEEFEHKEVTANGKNSIKGAIGEAAEQTAKGKIVIDAKKSEATVQSALSQCERAEGHLKLRKGIEIKGRVTVLTKSGAVRY